MVMEGPALAATVLSDMPITVRVHERAVIRRPEETLAGPCRFAGHLLACHRRSDHGKHPGLLVGKEKKDVSVEEVLAHNPTWSLNAWVAFGLARKRGANEAQAAKQAEKAMRAEARRANESGGGPPTVEAAPRYPRFVYKGVSHSTCT